MTLRIFGKTLALAASLSLAACHSAAPAPGMDAKDLSDDRGARAGRFQSPADNADATDATANDIAANDTAANDTGMAGNSLTTKGHQ